MSDAQREHASTVERLAPSLAALRVKLQSYMIEERFWIIYFILLLPRYLCEHDFELLSTSKIVESRDALLYKLLKNAQVENGNRKTLDKSQDGCMASEPQGKNVPSEEEASTDIISAGVEMDDKQNTEKWLEDERIDTGTSLLAQKKLEHEEDISFSDLEEDDNDLSNRLSGLKSAEETRVSSPRGCNNWVQQKGSSPESLVGGRQQRAVHSSSRDKNSEGFFSTTF